MFHFEFALLTAIPKKSLGLLAETPKCWWLFLLFSSMVWGQSSLPDESMHFLRRGNGFDAFPSEPFETVYRGSYGLAWFGNARGLLRYDSSNYQWYFHNPRDPNSIPPGTVRVLFEDSRGRFWVGTNGGLAILERETGLFENVPFQQINKTLTSSENVWTIFEDSSGEIWAGTASGLWSYEQSIMAPVIHDSGEKMGGILDLGEISPGQLLVARQNSQALCYQPQTNTFKAIAALKDAQINTILKDRNGNLWIGSENGCISQIDPKLRVLASYDLVPESDQNELLVSKMVQDKLGNIWIATTTGLFAFNQEEDSFVAYKHDPTKSYSLRSNIIRDIFSDNQNVLWVITGVAGFELFNLNQRIFQFNDLGSKGGRCLFQAPTGASWIGTDDGILVLDAQKQTVHHYLKGRKVRAIVAMDASHLLIGTTEGVLQVRMAQEPIILEHMLKEVSVWAIVKSPIGYLMASSEGLQSWQPETNSLTAFPFDSGDATGTNHRIVIDVTLENNQRFAWLGTYGGGVNRLNLETMTFDHYTKQENVNSGLLANDIVDLHIDNEERIWATSISTGLHRWDQTNKRFIPVSFPKSLSGEHPAAISSDHLGMLWLNSAHGLIRYNPEDQSFFRLTYADGVRTGSAVPGAMMFLANKKQILVGGLQGISAFSPEAFLNTQPKPLLFSGYTMGLKKLYHLLQPGSDVFLSKGTKTFSIEYSILDFLGAENQTYAYMRLGLDEDWVWVGKTGIVNYTNRGIFGGSFPLHVKGTDLNARTQQATLISHIPVPLWFRWLPVSIFLAVLLLTAFIYSILSLRAKRKHKALETQAILARQQQEIAENRSKVAEQQRSLEQQRRQFQEQHTQVLQEFLERQATQLANSLHDGPLAAVQGMGFSLMNLANNCEHQEVSAQLTHFRQQRIPPICDQLRQVCGELFTPDFHYGLKTELETYLQGVQQNRPKLNIHLDMPDQELPLSFDQKAMLFRIFRILVKNVETHSQASNIWITLKMNAQKVFLKVKDDGLGFEVPNDLNTFRRNKHYGLYMAQYFANSMGGTYQVSSKAGEGSYFQISMPVEQESEQV